MQLRKIVLIESDDHAADKAAECDAAVAFVRREIVALALRIVKFFLPRFYVDVGVSQLTEIDLWSRHVEITYRSLDRHVAQTRARQRNTTTRPGRRRRCPQEPRETRRKRRRRRGGCGGRRVGGQSIDSGITLPHY
jgi:hypothetical protein